MQGTIPSPCGSNCSELGYEMFEVSEGNPKLIPIGIERLKKRIEGDIAPETGCFINLLCMPSGSELRLLL